MPKTKQFAVLAVLSGCLLSAHLPAQTLASTHGQMLDRQAPLHLGSAAFTALLKSSSSGQQLLQLAGTPVCDINVYYYRYLTLGGAGELTTASAALMVPGGSNKACTSPRPLLLYAHGTTAYRNYNIADLTQSDPANGDGASEGVMVAAMYAAQGYIVVASNYAGYAGSTLSYHPYLNAAQQSGDVIDSMLAARLLLYTGAAGSVRDNGKLFVTGYSQGGFVALATHRALQAAGFNVTASAPGSGPYAMAAMADALIQGEVDLGSTVFTTLVLNSYQHAYGNLYAKAADVYAAPYAADGAATLLPSTTPLDTLFAQGKLPPTQLFSTTAPALQFQSLTPPAAPIQVPPQLLPLFASGFGPANLVLNSYRLAVLQDAFANPDGAFPNPSVAMAPAARPANPMRQAFKRNDLRNWLPRAPVQLCGGNSDPTVFFFNARIEQAWWQNAGVRNGLTSVLDVDSAPTGAQDPYAAVKSAFALAKAQVASQAVAAGAKDGGATAVIEDYHAGLVAPFCLLSARLFFANF